MPSKLHSADNKICSDREYFYIPLSFWFTESMAQALPLISLSHQVATLTVHLGGGVGNEWAMVPERWAKSVFVEERNVVEKKKKKKTKVVERLIMLF